MIMSSYQAASGSGQKAMDELITQAKQYTSAENLEYTGGFFGGKYFSKTNYHLKNIGKSEIKWV